MPALTRPTDSKAAALDRCQNNLADIRASGTHYLTTLSVALRDCAI